MKKEDLEEYTDIKRELRQLKERKMYLQEKKTSIKSQRITDSIRSAATNVLIDELLEKIEELEEVITGTEIELAEKELEVEEYISSIDKSVHRYILRAKYLQNKDFSVIAREIKFSYRHVTRLHKEIVDNI